MRQPLEQFARLGIVHHMLYPSCLTDADDHVRTLLEFVQRRDIETLDCCIPYGPARQALVAPAIRHCGKRDIVFAPHLFPLRKLSLSSPLAQEQAQSRLILEDMVNQAASIGAAGFIIVSGGPSPREATPPHHAAFADLLRWFCPLLARHGMNCQIEPFDTGIDKCFLYGPTKQCVELIESLKPQVNNLFIELDMAHVPLMGETFPDAIRTVGPHLARVHLGNCMLRDKSHPRYGDTHPPIGFPGGEVDVPQLVIILSELLRVGFLSEAKRGSVILEVTPWPGKTVEETLDDNWGRIRRAWELVPEACAAPSLQGAVR
jgi:sugar phosphate isomerase/epimerase